MNQRWQATRTALAETTERFAELVSATPDPRIRATRDWTVADTAAHVTAIAGMYTILVRPGDGPLPEPEVMESFLGTSVDTVAGFNVVTMNHFTERDLAALTERLRADVAEVLRVTADLDPDEPLRWLGDSRVPRCGMLAHLLNELQIHGRDIARGRKVPWTIPSAEAALFFDEFTVGLLSHQVGNLLVPDPRALPRRIAVEFRSPHTRPVVIVLQRDKVWVEEPGGEVDVRLRFDPAALNLMLFHRITRARAVLTGKLFVHGPRPWLIFPFLRTVRMP
ncbi:maleylpyruvate isomerase N-terminal domain-containing protein [Amycolatopsis anabasis]|uniref:maleylpyruvate isomerase N-terminal domain-containing protein n=1 Tax=Amycolatopsis anabasis TaxID=1840409 RepID=UPI00131DB502|nr:maleylpyruvate isomerase N-terminal domain-containing protein [Amycolatopsis anabasis]